MQFGIDGAERVDEVIVHWLDGATDRYAPFEAGRIFTLRRDAAG